MTSYDVLVIGAGSAGFDAATTARELGATRVALIESGERLGGECPNRACVPTKALLRSVEVLGLARRGREFGLKIPKVGFDFPAIMRRKQNTIDALTGTGRLEKYLKDAKIDLLRGSAQFVGTHDLVVGARRIRAKKIVIATGSRHAVPSIPGIMTSGFMTSDELVTLKRLPKSMVIIGGGPVGSESAQILRPLGVEVTLVEFAPRILSREDAEVSETVRRSFERQGIKVLVGTKVESVSKTKSVRVVVKGAKGVKKTLTAEAIMIAAGKQPATEGLALDVAGVKTDKSGAPVTNDYLQTSAKHIYAAGDVLAKMMFTHTAHTSGSVAARNAVRGDKEKYDWRVIPRGTFTTPEVGSVGLTEQEARDAGYKIRVGKVEYSYFGKALVTGEMEGFVKVVVDKKSDQILGGHIVGAIAADIVHEIALAMHARIPASVVSSMVHAYPTFAEAVGAAAGSIL